MKNFDHEFQLTFRVRCNQADITKNFARYEVASWIDACWYQDERSVVEAVEVVGMRDIFHDYDR